MSTVSFIAVMLGSFLVMEFVSYFAHRYVYHGIGWRFHKSHHAKRHGIFEKNDVFPAFFASMAMIVMITALQMPSLFWMLPISIGVSAYGVTYFLIHDVYIHRRFSWFKQLDSKYSRAILRAHGTHHSKRDKEDGESFGLLVVHPKFFKKRNKRDEEQIIGNNVR